MTEGIPSTQEGARWQQVHVHAGCSLNWYIECVACLRWKQNAHTHRSRAANGWCLTVRMSCAVRSCSAPSEAWVVGDGEHTSASLNVHFHVVMQHMCCSLSRSPSILQYCCFCGRRQGCQLQESASILGWNIWTVCDIFCIKAVFPDELACALTKPGARIVYKWDRSTQQTLTWDSVQISSGFKDYVLAPAYPDGYLPDPAYPYNPKTGKGVTVECSGYCN